jgi:Fe-S-cluster containining protein
VSAETAEALLAEYRAVVAKVDAKADEIFARRDDDVACRKGCADCCAPGLSVLPVEAFAIETKLEERAAAGDAALPSVDDKRCVFLDSGGACSIYEDRPLLCRTHGLPIRMPGGGGRGQLPVLDDDTWACALNFTQAPPEPDDVMCGTTLMVLLATVDARFRERAGLPAGDDRVALAAVHAAYASE